MVFPQSGGGGRKEKEMRKEGGGEDPCQVDLEKRPLSSRSLGRKRERREEAKARRKHKNYRSLSLT